MRLLQAIAVSSLCYMTRVTCAVVPVFDDATPAKWQSSRRQSSSPVRQPTSPAPPRSSAFTDLHSDSLLALQAFLRENVERCIAETPEGHGVLLHIDDPQTMSDDYSDTEDAAGEDTQQGKAAALEKRFIKAAGKLWKGLPGDQRIAVVGALASAISVPGYLVSAANAANEENIHNIKAKAAEKIVFAEAAKAGKAAKAAKEKHAAPAKKTRREATYDEWDALLAPDADELSRRGSLKLSSNSMKILNGGRSAAAHYAHSHSPVPHAGHSAAAPTAAAPTSHAALGKILTWTGITSGLLYVPTAISSYHRAVAKSDDDLAKYRRRAVLQRRYGMPAVTCIAIERTGAEDYVIPKGALSHTPQKRRHSDFTDQIAQQRGNMQEAGFVRREPQSAALQRVGSHAKMAGIGVLGLAMGYSMHQMGQRRSETNDDASSLVGRDLQEDTDDLQAQRRWTPGKGSVLFGGILAGGAVSRAGLWHPEKHATLVEAPARKRSLGAAQQPFQSYASAPDVQKRGGIRAQIHKGAMDKVTMSVGALALGFASVKTGLFGKASDALKRPSPQQQAKAAAAAGAAPAARRTIDMEEDDEELEMLEIDDEGIVVDRRGMPRSLVIPVSAFAGVLLGQRTGKQGQKNENNRYLQSIGEKPPAVRRDVEGEEEAPMQRRLAAGVKASGRSLSRSLSRSMSKMHVPSMRVTKIVAEARGSSSARGASHSRSPSPSPRYRSSSPPPDRGRSLQRGSGSRSSSSGQSRSVSRNPDVKNFYKDNPQVKRPNAVKEVHVIHHNDAPGAGEAAAPAAAAKKGGGKGKAIVGAAVGVGAGVAGHTMYTNAQAAKAAQAGAAAPSTESAAAEPAPAPARRSLSSVVDNEEEMLARRNKKYQVVHEHVWHHAMPTGPPHGSVSVHSVKTGGGGAKKAIVGLIGGVIAGVVGHAMWNNAKVAQQKQQEQGGGAPAEAAPPAAPARREHDEGSLMIKRSPAPQPIGKVPTAITGAFAGVTAAAWVFSRGHDEPGTARKHTVPAGTLPTPLMRKRSILFVAMPAEYDDANDALTRREPFNFGALKQLSDKSKGHIAIAGGLLLSTAVAVVDPGQKEAQKRLGKRDDGEVERRAFNAKALKNVGGALKKFGAGMSKKQKTGVAIAGGVGISVASASAQKANDKAAAAAAGAAPPPAAKRSLDDEDGDSDVRKRAFRKALKSMSTKQKTGAAIAGGIGISVASAAAQKSNDKAAAQRKRSLPEDEWMDERRVASDEQVLRARANFGNLGKSFKTFVRSSSTNRDAVVVAGVAAGAATLGLMKRDEAGDDEFDKDDVALYFDREDDEYFAADGRRIVLLRHPADLYRRAGGAEAKIGRMMDVGTIAMLAGSGLRFVHQRMTGAGSKAPEAASKIKRSIVVVNDVDGEESLRKREPVMNALMTTASLAPMALPVAAPAAKAVKNVAKGAVGKVKGLFSKKKGKRDSELDEQQILVRRAGAGAAAMNTLTLAPMVLPAAGPAVKVAKTAAKGVVGKVKSLIGKKGKRDVESDGQLILVKRDPLLAAATTAASVAPLAAPAAKPALKAAKGAVGKIKGLFKKKGKRSIGMDEQQVLVRRSATALVNAMSIANTMAPVTRPAGKAVKKVAVRTHGAAKGAVNNVRKVSVGAYRGAKSAMNKRELDNDEDDDSDNNDDDVQWLQKREPIVPVLMGAAAAAPVVIPMAKPAAKVVATAAKGLGKKIGKLFHKRDGLDDDSFDDYIRLDRRDAERLEARDMAKATNVGMTGLMAVSTGMPLVSYVARKFKGKPKGKRSVDDEEVVVLRRRSEPGRIDRRAVMGNVMTGTMLGGLAHPIATYAVGGGRHARRSLQEDGATTLRATARSTAGRRDVRSGVEGNALARRNVVANGMNGVMVGGLVEPLASSAVRGVKKVLGKKQRQRPAKRAFNERRGSPLVKRGSRGDVDLLDDDVRDARIAFRSASRRRPYARWDDVDWTQGDEDEARLQARAAFSYKLLAKASFATIGGSLAAPFIKSAFASKPKVAKRDVMPEHDMSSPDQWLRRSPKEQEYGELINKLKSEVEGKGK